MSVDPTAIAKTDEHGQQHRADDGEEAGNDCTTITGGAHKESAGNSATDAHHDVHEGAVAISFQGSSGPPANQYSDENPCD